MDEAEVRWIKYIFYNEQQIINKTITNLIVSDKNIKVKRLFNPCKYAKYGQIILLNSSEMSLGYLQISEKTCCGLKCNIFLSTFLSGLLINNYNEQIL